MTGPWHPPSELAPRSPAPMSAHSSTLLFGLLVIVSALPGPAIAQFDASSNSTTVHLGGGFVVTETDHTVDNVGPLTVEPFGALIRVQRRYPGVSLGLGYQIGLYPYVTPAGRRGPRHTVRLLGEWSYPSLDPVEPYVGAGPTMMVAPERVGAGISASAGLRAHLNEVLAVFAEGVGHFVWPDDAVDATAGGRASFDTLGLLAFGIRFQPMGR